VSGGQLPWEGPFRVDSDKDTYRCQLQDSPGIYRIRAFTSPRDPIIIARCNGRDPDGILHIGETKCLRTRLRHFRDAAIGNGNSHAAGCEFRDYGFASQFPKESL